MKFYQNTFVLILFMHALMLSAIDCKGNRPSSSQSNPLSGGSLTRSGQSSDAIAKPDSRRPDIDFNAASETATGGSSNVALASYVSRDKKENQSQWLESYEEAVQLSKQTGKPILADFTGSNWCPPCMKLKKEIFETPTFKSWAAENVILLELDFPRPNLQADWIKKQNYELSGRYKIISYPTVLILDSEGRKQEEFGYMRGGPERWISVVNKKIQASQALQ